MITPPEPALGQLTANQVHIWHLPLVALAAYTPHLLPLLSEQERESYQRACKFQKHPPQIASRALLRLLLARYIHSKEPNPGETCFTPTARTSAIDIVITHGEHGKPSLQDYPWLQYSVSHTKTDIVFALTRNDRLGIDIETSRKISDYLDLAERFFSPAEYTYLSTLSAHDGRQAFIKLWTVKEAFVKAVGFGLSYPLPDFTVAFINETPVIIDKAQVKEPSQAKDWQCHIWQLGEYSSMAVVTEGAPKQFFFGILDAAELCEPLVS